MTALEWARERQENSRAIANSKIGTERDGWREDLAYWGEIVNALARVAALEAVVGRIDAAGAGAETAADELMTEFVSKQRAAHWGKINEGLCALAALRRDAIALLTPGAPRG